ncbi:conserved mitochondrial Maf domain-containing protein [Andalucia godoyi]|uniref:Conserved mitochondrial Maf domain-containing protein n=1 Tax=Andalucia godoyi TaxID=505711 RepID=A0A8K0AGM5_ANDGO|nr:conserved mitochondrial Maf domain-containing protein [Andalucia godoyi]|eukprot:ANDGO_06704.mRNA.1 conserved mitochondrial Maf domain-containing protein
MARSVFSGNVLSTLLTLASRYRVILASSSPRRKELLSQLLGCSVSDPSFEVVPSTFAEDLNPGDFPSTAAYVAETGRRKLIDIVERVACTTVDDADRRPVLVIAADTIVVVDGAGVAADDAEGGRQRKGQKVLNKPESETEHLQMLRLLNGAPHTVQTALWIAVPSQSKVLSGVAETTVRFAECSEDALQAYVQTGEAKDAAGGYKIQGLGGVLVQSIEGEYANVVGFPVHLFAQLSQSL